MDKKVRYVYELEAGEITEWNDEIEDPEDFNPISYIDNIDIPYATADPLTAYTKYRERVEFFDGFVMNWNIKLTAVPVLVSDDEWLTLLKKETLDYEDYRAFCADGTSRVCAQEFEYGSVHSSDDFFISDEILKAQCEFFNMRMVCQKAGISYSTFRGFKNNNQPFSIEKKIALLRCMQGIGRACWNDTLQDKYGYFMAKQ